MANLNLPNNQPTIKICSVESCDRKTHGKGLCKMHRKRFLRNGSPELQYKPTLEERFWANIQKDAVSGCWNWQASKNRLGYGAFAVDRKYIRAHRFSYELIKGKIPEGLVIDHLCRNPSCVNPDHLEAVTEKENTMRGVGLGAINAKKTHCPQMHEYTEENTCISSGRRHCRTCSRIKARERRKRKYL